jgi:two-component system, OmpR family, phosphate regulon sensor histidine kinase PhoR
LNYLKRFFIFLLLFSMVIIWACGFPPASKWVIAVSAAFLGAAVLKRYAVKPWTELKSSLLRIKKGEYEARLDDVKGGDVRECAEIFNELAEELSKYRKLSENREKRLTALINSVNSGLFLFDPDSKLLLANTNISIMFPYFRKEAPFASLDIPFLQQFIDESKEGDQRNSRRFKEGSKGRGRFFNITYVPLEEGNWAVIVDDITAEARMEEVKSELVANVSHELRTPLSAISALMDVIERDDTTADERKDFHQRLKKQTGRMSSLLEDLLSLSRLEGGEVAPSPREINIKSFLEEMISMLEPLKESLSVDVELSTGGGINILSDPLLLEQSLKNILDNAIRYNRQNGKVFVRALEEGGLVKIEVEDTGDGIRNEDMERVFERFYRVDQHRSRERGGTGLGLSIAKHAVKILNGEIRLESNIGKGSKFTVTIPKYGKE